MRNSELKEAVVFKIREAFPERNFIIDFTEKPNTNSFGAEIIVLVTDPITSVAHRINQSFSDMKLMHMKDGVTFMSDMIVSKIKDYINDAEKLSEIDKNLFKYMNKDDVYATRQNIIKNCLHLLQKS